MSLNTVRAAAGEATDIVGEDMLSADPFGVGDLRHTIETIIDGSNDGILNENANKDKNSIPTRRDLIAGAAVKDYALSRMDPRFARAHKLGVIHIHDLDYFSGDQINCSIPNVEDMFKNGTAISDKAITTPKSLQTAATLLSQIIAQVASNQYGGTTINNVNELLAPYLRASHEKYKKMLSPVIGDEDKLEDAATILSDKELSAAIQTISYQISTLSTSNGQTPFVTMSLRTLPDFEYKEESNRIIAEILNQRIKGIPGASGNYETQIFPKLIFFTNEYNVPADSEFHWLLRKAAECTASRMYPDYVSEKIMKRDYDGQVFAPMGCARSYESVLWTFRGRSHYTGIGTMFDELADVFEVRTQPDGVNDYIDLEGVTILDSHDGTPRMVECRRMVRNFGNDWVKVKTDCGINLHLTTDHPLHVEGKGRVFAADLEEGDILLKSAFENADQGIVPDSDSEIQRQKKTTAVRSVEPVTLSEASYDVTTESDYFDLSGVVSHNCRSFLPPYYDGEGAPVVEGRFNKGVATVNVPRCAIVARIKVLGREHALDASILPWDASGADVNKSSDVVLADGDVVSTDVAWERVRAQFWKELDSSLEILKGVQRYRVECLKGTKAGTAPMLWCHGALARLDPDDVIDPLFYGGYSSLSIGYIGLYEASELATGHSNFGNVVGNDFTVDIVRHLEQKADEWNEEDSLGWSVYGTPSESLVGRFASLIRAQFGAIPGIVDDNKTYLTNSFHVNVTQPTDAFSKIKFESQFQPLSKGGTISYVEMGDLRKNVDAILSVIEYAYNHILYSEFNGRSENVCLECGHQGEILIEKDELGNWGYQCPRCGNRDNAKIIAVARVCGYLGDNRHGISSFKLQEFKQRVIHI